MKNKMPIIVGLTIIVFVVQAYIAYTIEFTDTLGFLIRVSALWGYLALSVATISTPFMREIRKRFGVVFLNFHHVFATIGLVFLSLHPVLLAYKYSNIRVFIPSLESWYKFWALGGRPALIIIYVSVIAIFVRRRIPSLWRPLHGLMYVASLLGVVHGNMIGTDFGNIAIRWFNYLLFGATVLAFIYKRVQRNNNNRNNNK